MQAGYVMSDALKDKQQADIEAVQDSESGIATLEQCQQASHITQRLDTILIPL